MHPKELVEKIKDEMRLNETQIAKKTGIPQPTIHRIANGTSKNCRYNTYIKIKEFYEQQKTPSTN